MNQKYEKLKNVTDAQKEWLQKYEDWTTFEPMNYTYLEDGSVSFDEVARSSIRWYEGHSGDAYSRITDNVPYTEDKWL